MSVIKLLPLAQASPWVPNLVMLEPDFVSHLCRLLLVGSTNRGREREAGSLEKGLAPSWVLSEGSLAASLQQSPFVLAEVAESSWQFSQHW